MHATFRTGVTAALCAAAAATTFAGNASAGPIGIASAVIKVPSAAEQIYYRRYGGRYYRNGYAYGPRYYYGRPAYGYGYGYGYGYPYAYPVVPVPLPVPFFGW